MNILYYLSRDQLIYGLTDLKKEDKQYAFKDIEKQFNKVIRFIKQKKEITLSPLLSNKSFVKIYLNMIYLEMNPIEHESLQFIKQYIINPQYACSCYGFGRNDMDFIYELFSYFCFINLVDFKGPIPNEKRFIKEQTDIAIFKSEKDYNLLDISQFKYVLILEKIKKALVSNDSMSFIKIDKFTKVKNNNQIQTMKNNEHLKKLLSEFKIKDNYFIGSDDQYYSRLRKIYGKYQFKTSGYSFAKEVINYVNSLNHRVQTYLDFGAGDGIKTTKLMEMLNLKKEQVYGLDLGEFYSTSHQKNYAFNYVIYDGITIPKFNVKFNMITMTQVLHHIKNFHDILDQLERYFDERCLLIIKEHDCIDDTFANIIDIEHSIYERVYNNDEKFKDEYYAHYFSKEEIIAYFIGRGYKYITSSPNHIKTTNSLYHVFSYKN